MRFETGSLVTARDREWIVQAESSDDMLVLRPVGGTEHEITGIYLPLEPDVKLAQFDLPSTKDLGDYNSAQLLRDAVQLSFRSTAGPFRSFGKLGFQPRPYQVVPLIVALRQDPVRLLLADDVGIGKTVESCLIAKELIERRESRRLAVLCPPHLAQQWHDELYDKFNIDAQVVLPSTVRKLERGCSFNESLFDIYPHVVVSIDFIKSDRRKDDFVRACPDLVIVDEAHSAAFGGALSSAQHRRHELLKALAANPNRHLILVTATPHSGKEEAFRSLLRLLSDKFIDLPMDLGGDASRKNRELVAAYFIQRKRPDIEKYLGTNTHFPARKVREESYLLSEDYRDLFLRVLNFTREFVSVDSGAGHRQRVRWWSALGLLRALSSSPAATVATLRSRASSAETSSIEDADERGRLEIFDSEDIDDSFSDQSPGADIGEETSSAKLSAFASAAEKLFSPSHDTKLAKLIAVVKELLDEGFSPIVFCRFVATAHYIAEHLSKELNRNKSSAKKTSGNVQVKWVTGELTPAEREQEIAGFVHEKPRVLVTTDCLSEGINLQEKFDAIIHYDLAWNPTRHEQREGRVDRFGQMRKEIRVVTIYGRDNQIDGIVLDVLLRKQRSIRNDLGVSIPIPVDADSVVEAIFEGLLLREESGAGKNHSNQSQQLLPGFDEYFKPKREDLHAKWDEAAEREKRSRALFAQHSVKVEEVAQEVDASENATGANRVKSFVESASKACGGYLRERGQGQYELDLAEAPLSLRDLLPEPRKYNVTFDTELKDSGEFLHRTHPITEGLSTYVFNSALDRFEDGVARRCGVVRTDVIDKRTTMLLLRLRFQISFKMHGVEQIVLAEQCGTKVFQGPPSAPEWIDSSGGENGTSNNADLLSLLYSVQPKQNVAVEQARDFIGKVLSAWPTLNSTIEAYAKEESAALLASHQRVRNTIGRIPVNIPDNITGDKTTLDSQPNLKIRAKSEKQGRNLRVVALPADVLGIYIYLPVLQS